MSKTRREGSGKGRLRRAAAGLLALSLVCGLLPAVSQPVQAAGGESWAQTHLDKLVAWDVMRGDIEGNLDPDRNISRAEFVTMVNRAYGYDETGVNPFTDVESTAWYSDDISIAYTVGYFTGTSATTASPDRGLTREQAALLLGRNMMLQDTPGETLGYTDSRDFSEWSRNIIRAVTEAGVINGYPDGSFRPQAEITRGEVASMLTKALGTPVQEPGVHNLGSVYGNVTVTSSGVTLRNTVIAGDLYLTGGIGLGDVLLENVTVLGRIVTSGAGESNKGESSIILRNVKANEMILDSISNQFVTVRAEGDTDIASTSVRTPAYMEDMTPANLGFRYIELDGESGINLQLAGNVKEVVNLTPNSSLIVARGAAEKITVDEKAAGSTLAIDLGGRVKELNLDTGTTVSGGGDVDHVNINTAGSTLAVPPDTVTVRPGITAGIAGENMDSVTAAEFSEDPRLLAGYPVARNVAPTSASAVFSTNKRGTVYWALSALADGSVNEDDVISPPTYAGKILKSGNLPVAASKTEYSANITGLTTDGSYYLTAVMVDSRGQRSPVKVTAFTTPDDTVPAFATGYPTMSKITSTSGQVTVMTTKDCLVYYALLPQGSTAPRAQDFKLGVISGSLGYGSVDAVKNSTLPFTVNNIDLEEQVTYDLYLWLTDYDGAKSSSVQKVTFTTVDGTPPIVRHMDQTDAKAASVDMTYSMNEPGTLYWAVVKEGETFFRPLAGQTVPPQPADPAAKSQVESGMGALVKGSSPAARADTDIKFTISGLQGETSYDLYYVAKDKAGNYSDAVQKVTISTLDNNAPTVKQEFTRFNGSEEENNLMPLSDTDIRLVFSESVQGVETVLGQRRYDKFIELYRAVETAGSGQAADQARDVLATALQKYITMYVEPAGSQPGPAPVRPATRDEANPAPYDSEWVIDYRYATVTMEDGEMVITFPSETALNLSSGETYHFQLTGIADTSTAANLMGSTTLPSFTTVFSTVNISPANVWELDAVENTDYLNRPVTVKTPVEVDMSFQLDPIATGNTAEGIFYDMMIWSDTALEFELYARDDNTANGGWSGWVKQPTFTYTLQEDGSFVYRTMAQVVRSESGGTSYAFNALSDLMEGVAYQYAIHVTRLNGNTDRSTWNKTVNLQVTVAAGAQSDLRLVASGSTETDWRDAKEAGVYSIGVPDPYTRRVPFSDTSAPKLVSPYPRFDTGDTVANMTFLLTRPGTVYYVVTPVKVDGTELDTPVPPTAIKLDNNGVAISGSEYTPLPTTVPESGSDTGQGVNRPTYLSLPTEDTIINSNITESTVRQGRIANNGASTCTVHLTDLQPLTTYYVYLMFQGTQQVVSDYAECYKFTTEEVSRPILNLQVVNNSNVDASVDKTAEVYAKLLYAGNVGSPFNDQFYSETNIDEKYYNATGSDAMPDRFKDATYTVLQAMIDSIGSSGTCSVFDQYASIGLKNTVASLIREGNIGNTIVDGWGPQTIEQDRHEVIKFDEERMDEDSSYICVAVAKSPLGSGDAFRAARPVQLVDTEWPLITDVAVNLNHTVDAATGADKVNGNVVVIFNKVLYLPLDNRNYPLALNMQLGKITSNGVDYCGLGGKFRPMNDGVSIQEDAVDKLAPTNTLIYTFEDVQNPNYTIPLPLGLCNRWGYSAGTGSIRLSYDRQNNTFSYTITPASWQAPGT